MPQSPRQTTHSKVREAAGWSDNYLHEDYFIRFLGAEDLFTDGPKLWVNRTTAIVLSPTLERRITFTQPTREFIQNGRANFNIFFWGDGGVGGDLELTVNVYAHILGEDPEGGGTLIRSWVPVVTVVPGTLQQADLFGTYPDDPVIRHDHDSLSFEIVHTPTNPANTYAEKVFVQGCRFRYEPNFLQ